MHSIAEIPGLIAKGDEDAFYSWPEWKRLKADVLRLDRFECQECRKICAVIDEAGLSVAGVAENGELHIPNLEYLGSVEFTSTSINGSSSFSIRSPESWVDNINRPILTCLILCTSGYVPVPVVTCRVPGYDGTFSEICIGKYSKSINDDYFNLTNIGIIDIGVRNTDPTVITFSFNALGMDRINYCIINAWK